MPDRKELAATAVLALGLAEASVKIRTGPPGDDERDLDGPEVPDPVWAGMLPLRTVAGDPEPCPLLPAGVAVPGRVRDRALSLGA